MPLAICMLCGDLKLAIHLCTSNIIFFMHLNDFHKGFSVFKIDVPSLCVYIKSLKSHDKAMTKRSDRFRANNLKQLISIHAEEVNFNIIHSKAKFSLFLFLKSPENCRTKHVKVSFNMFYIYSLFEFPQRYSTRRRMHVNCAQAH